MSDNKNKGGVTVTYTLRIGGYKSKVAADIDAVEFNDPSVFYIRTSLFRDTQKLGITAQTTCILPFHKENRIGFDEYGFYLTVVVRAADKQTAAIWIKRCEERAKNLSSTNYVREGAVRPEKNNED